MKLSPQVLDFRSDLTLTNEIEPKQIEATVLRDRDPAARASHGEPAPMSTLSSSSIPPLNSATLENTAIAQEEAALETSLPWRADLTTEGFRHLVKRVMDVAGALIALVMLWWVMVLIALLIRFTSRGPILFQQARRGYRGRIFQVLKFRTMTVDAEQRLVDLESSNESAGGVLFKLRNDPRVTKLGAFLRRTSLDELPAAHQRAVRRDEPGRPPAPPAPGQRQAAGHPSRGLSSPPPGLARHHGALAGRRPERAGLCPHDRSGCRIRPELVAGSRTW